MLKTENIFGILNSQNIEWIADTIYIIYTVYMYDKDKVVNDTQ